MKKIPGKNYFILAILILVTVVLTLVLSNIYLAKSRKVSEFFEYSNKITPSELDVYLTENPDVIIYISDKYNLENTTVEKKLKEKLDSTNLKDKMIYIDKSEIDNKFISKIKENYNIDIDINKLPIIIVVIDGEYKQSIYVNNGSDADTFIDYEAFE